VESDVPCKAVGARLSSGWQPDRMRATKERTGISSIHNCTGWRIVSSRFDGTKEGEVSQDALGRECAQRQNESWSLSAKRKGGKEEQKWFLSKRTATAKSGQLLIEN
jgi:hypothetical protein